MGGGIKREWYPISFIYLMSRHQRLWNPTWIATALASPSRSTSATGVQGFVGVKASLSSFPAHPELTSAKNAEAGGDK